MYNGKYNNRAAKPVRRRRSRGLSLPVFVAILLLTFTVSGTLAWLSAQTTEVENTFTPSNVTCQVNEEFDGTEKTNVNVTNTGNIDAYLRVRLVTYRVNEKDERIGGTAEIPEFTPGEGWFYQGGYYYYQNPVAPGEKPTTELISSIPLVKYDDADGGKQVIEVIAEAIQAQGVDESGTPAVTTAWKVTVNVDGTITG